MTDAEREAAAVVAGLAEAPCGSPDNPHIFIWIHQENQWWCPSCLSTTTIEPRNGSAYD